MIPYLLMLVPFHIADIADKPPVCLNHQLLCMELLLTLASLSFGQLQATCLLS